MRRRNFLTALAALPFAAAPLAALERLRPTRGVVTGTVTGVDQEAGTITVEWINSDEFERRINNNEHIIGQYISLERDVRVRKGSSAVIENCYIDSPSGHRILFPGWDSVEAMGCTFETGL